MTQSPQVTQALPVAMPGHWDTPEGHEMATGYLARSREELCHGELSDLALANRVYMASRDDLDLLAWQTAAKERIRWLSAQLASRQSPQPPQDAVERVARRLFVVLWLDANAALSEDVAEDAFNKLNDDGKRLYRQAARAAIAAITPSPGEDARELLVRGRNWQREMERSSDALHALAKSDMSLTEAAEGNGAVAETLEDLCDFIERALAPSQGVIEALRKAAEKFREYERLHMAKGNLDGDAKARVNCLMAEMCEAALSTAAADQDGGE